MRQRDYTRTAIKRDLQSATPTSTTTCGTGLLVCEVQDPTRSEAPWHGASAPFPQCYDPSVYACSENFLCPVNAPKIPGQYTCGPYNSGTTNPTSVSAHPASTISTTPNSVPTESQGCGPGTLLCEVEDPTRLEAPWHGVYAAFPQCYDPTLYTCADNFLCPINAPKIPAQYACGPYETPLSSSQNSITSASVGHSARSTAHFDRADSILNRKLHPSFHQPLFQVYQQLQVLTLSPPRRRLHPAVPY